MISFTRSYAGFGGSGTANVSITTAPADGALLLITVVGRPDEIASVTDNGDGANLWRPAVVGPAGDDQSGIYYKLANATDVAQLTTVTVQGTQASNYEIVYGEFASTTGWETDPLDVTASDPVKTNVVMQTTGTTAATTQAEELAVGLVYIRGTSDIGSPVAWTNTFVQFGQSLNAANFAASSAIYNVSSYKILDATGTQESTASWPNTANSAKGFIATFKTLASVEATISMDLVHGSGKAEDIFRSAGYDSDTEILTISGSATGASLIEININGSGWVTATGTNTWSYDLDVSTLTAGQHTIQARVNSGEAIDQQTIWHNPGGLYGAAVTPGDHLVPISLL